ncbi:MAG: precorrin-6y C5,15-methyltransferase (decarboxylating) subunit CbiE [Actinomycetota bacterium]|jgi:precorrin-6Y C5,15-methyltransferase (decarboxylating)|nr:precorrin-6y C5,15-methyltransferase (decarboxylating) subunit CbiE [Actinomycetota bacterium]
MTLETLVAPDGGRVPIAVVGVHGGLVYGPGALAALANADVVVGSPRQLSQTASLCRPEADTVVLAGPLDEVLDRVEDASGAGRAVSVLASGDPGFFGIVRVLAARVGRGLLQVHPAPSAVSLAFARLGLSWDDATVVSAHGRPLADAVRAVRSSAQPSVAILTSPDNPPQLVAEALIAAGEPTGPEAAAAVASRLGEQGEAVTVSDLSDIAEGSFDPMSVLVLTGRAASPGVPSLAWGLAEAAFDRRDGMITKAEVRAVALGKLDLPPFGVLWDVGAGSGSVGIECGRLRPGLDVFAVERDRAQVDRIRSNADRHRVKVTVTEGEAPDALVGLPDPDRVFVGGGGSEVLDAVLGRLRPTGVVVATYAVVDRAVAAAAVLGNVVELSVSRGVATGGLGVRLRAENPVFVCWGPET